MIRDIPGVMLAATVEGCVARLAMGAGNGADRFGLCLQMNGQDCGAEPIRRCPACGSHAGALG